MLCQTQPEEKPPIIHLVKGELTPPALRTRKAYCDGCIPTTPAMDASPDEQYEAHPKKHCLYEGLKESELPAFFTPRTEPITHNRWGGEDQISLTNGLV